MTKRNGHLTAEQLREIRDALTWGDSHHGALLARKAVGGEPTEATLLA